MKQIQNLPRLICCCRCSCLGLSECGTFLHSISETRFHPSCLFSLLATAALASSILSPIKWLQGNWILSNFFSLRFFLSRHLCDKKQKLKINLKLKTHKPTTYKFPQVHLFAWWNFWPLLHSFQSSRSAFPVQNHTQFGQLWWDLIPRSTSSYCFS